MERPLTPQEVLYCREYLVDFNATQAAIRAKYAPNYAAQQAQQLMARPCVHAELKRTVGAVMERAEVDAAEVLSMIKSMAMVDPEDIFTDLGYMKPLSLIPKPARLCISSIKNSRYGSSVQLEGRLKALDLLGKYLKLWQDGININANAGDEPMTVVFDFTGTTRGPGEEPIPEADKYANMFE